MATRYSLDRWQRRAKSHIISFAGEDATLYMAIKKKFEREKGTDPEGIGHDIDQVWIIRWLQINYS